MIDRGDRIYNGLPSKLMNDIYDILTAKCDILEEPYWPILSLYLARTCGILERRGWRNENN